MVARKVIGSIRSWYRRTPYIYFSIHENIQKKEGKNRLAAPPELTIRHVPAQADQSEDSEDQHVPENRTR